MTQQRYDTLRIFFMLFTGLFILSFPFGYHFLPDIGKYSTLAFEPVVRWAGRRFGNRGPSFSGKIASDSLAMYIDLAMVALAALLLTGIVRWMLKKRKVPVTVVFEWFQVAISYYLSLQLLQYGCSKLFKAQFYLPEPNTLFTRIGDTSRDLLYWSTMGLSRSYTVFSGLVEVVPACLLFFRRTRVLGAFVLSGVMLNVVWVNFSFDISVKIYSSFLLLLSLVLAMPAYRLLFCFFVQKRIPVIPAARAAALRSRPRLYMVIKTGVIALILTEALWMYVAAGNFNDDRAPRPLLHGAWQVRAMVRNGDTVTDCSLPWKRVFVHRRGYFIIQDNQDKMADYRLYYNVPAAALTLKNYETGDTLSLQYHLQGDRLDLRGMIAADTLTVLLQQIPLGQLPVLQKGFHWTSDE